MKQQNHPGVGISVVLGFWLDLNIFLNVTCNTNDKEIEGRNHVYMDRGVKIMSTGLEMIS